LSQKYNSSLSQRKVFNLHIFDGNWEYFSNLCAVLLSLLFPHQNKIDPVAHPRSSFCRLDTPRNAKQDIQIYTPLSSRIARLDVLDALAIDVAQKKGPQLEAHLQELQAGLASKYHALNDSTVIELI